NLRDVLTQAVLQIPMFGTRFRWEATRSLALLRFAGGRKVPPPLQRMRSDDLLGAVFPAQVACQDNTPPGDIEIPDHPLVFEAMRDCLTEAMDIEGLERALVLMERGEIEVFARETVQPSVFAHQVLNALPYAFLDDAPLEERRARAVSLRRALPEDSRELARLDPEAIVAEARNAWPLIRSADELHDALLTLGLLPEDAAGGPASGPQPDLAPEWFAELARARRAHRLLRPGAPPAWVAAERLPLIQTALPHTRLDPQPSSYPVSLVRGWVECSGPLTVAQLAGTLGLRRSDVQYALARLENEGLVLRGRFHPDANEEEFCDRRILARIHRATIAELRRRVEPVPQAAFLRFLFRWQHLEPGSQLRGEGGLLDVLAQLQGFESPAGAWEKDVLAPRIAEYQPGLLDALSFSGEVVWGRMSPPNGGAPASGRSPFTRATAIALALRESLAWLRPHEPAKAPTLTGAAREVLDLLAQRGASFLPDLVARTRRMPSDVERALQQLAAA
ncbi:MAG: DEAD/DEAH box helicase, partial [SAR202 cluster bacterium]|nr:DEAD/DEAH box helicase [SAR202 cluster bacterium]